MLPGAKPLPHPLGATTNGGPTEEALVLLRGNIIKPKTMPVRSIDKLVSTKELAYERSRLGLRNPENFNLLPCQQQGPPSLGILPKDISGSPFVGLVDGPTGLTLLPVR
jgi:hypothetical protein